MDIYSDYSDHHEPISISRGSFPLGLRIAQNIIRWLIRMVIPTEEELAEAGVYLGKMYI